MFVTTKDGKFRNCKSEAEIVESVKAHISMGLDGENDVMVVSHPLYHDKGDMTGAQFLRAVGQNV